MDTPLGRASVELVDPSQPVAVVPILRAGLVLLEQSSTVLPAQQTFHFGACRSPSPHCPHALTVARTSRAGVKRDEETLLPRVYLNNLPASFAPETRILVSDPMMATGAASVAARTRSCCRLTSPCCPRAGGSVCACLDALLERGASLGMIRVVGVVAAPPALKRLSETYPGVCLLASCACAILLLTSVSATGLRVYVAMIDEELDARGRIVPGLGDAGDRSFGTSA